MRAKCHTESTDKKKGYLVALWKKKLECLTLGMLLREIGLSGSLTRACA